MTDRAVLGLAFAALVVIAGGAFWLLTYEPSLRPCEEAIKHKLVAPATYKRVKVNSAGGGDLFIDYDAQNSFGVPLRGHGLCSIDAEGKVDWFEY